MSVQAVAHLNFHGQARAALEFYRSVFGGHTIIATYGDLGMPADLPDASNVVFGQVIGSDGFTVMAYDMPSRSQAAETQPAATLPPTRRENGVTLTNEPFFVSVRADTVEEIEAYWAKLADGATIIEPLHPSQWAPAFGMLTDRFRIVWILDVGAPNHG